MKNVDEDKIKEIIDILKFEEKNYENCIPVVSIFDFIENHDYYNELCENISNEYENIIMDILSDCTMDELDVIAKKAIRIFKLNFALLINQCCFDYFEIGFAFLSNIKRGNKEEYIEKLSKEELNQIKILLGFKGKIKYVFDDKQKIIKEVDEVNYDLTLHEIFIKNLLDSYDGEFKISNMIYRYLIRQCEIYLNEYFALSVDDDDNLYFLCETINEYNSFIDYVLENKSDLDKIHSLDELYEYSLKSDNAYLKIIIKNVIEKVGKMISSYNKDNNQDISLSKKIFLLNAHDPYYNNGYLTKELSYDNLIKLSDDIYNEKLKIANENGFNSYEEYVDNFLKNQEKPMDKATKYKMFRYFNKKYDFKK